MPKRINLREATKTNWWTAPRADDASDYPGDENIKIGCLLRIADSVELMAKNHLDMQRRIRFLEEDRDRYINLAENRRRSLAAQKGVITKLKKKMK